MGCHMQNACIYFTGLSYEQQLANLMQCIHVKCRITTSLKTTFTTFFLSFVFKKNFGIFSMIRDIPTFLPFLSRSKFYHYFMSNLCSSRFTLEYDTDYSGLELGLTFSFLQHKFKCNFVGKRESHLFGAIRIIRNILRGRIR